MGRGFGAARSGNGRSPIGRAAARAAIREVVMRGFAELGAAASATKCVGRDAPELHDREHDDQDREEHEHGDDEVEADMVAAGGHARRLAG